MKEIDDDETVKSRRMLEFVIPAEAGIQKTQTLLDPRFRGGDGDLLRTCQTMMILKKNPSWANPVALI